MNMIKHNIIIVYSEEDEGYIAVVPELPGCSAFGTTVEQSLEEIKTAMELWLETASKEGREIPKPRGKRGLFLWEVGWGGLLWVLRRYLGLRPILTLVVLFS